jgi:hypothetical protein
MGLGFTPPAGAEGDPIFGASPAVSITAAMIDGLVNTPTAPSVSNYFLTLADISGLGGGETFAQTLALGNSTGANNISIDEGQSIVYNTAAGGPFTGNLSGPTLTGNHVWTLPNATGTIALTSDIPSITDDRIPRGTGTTVEDGTWTNVGNDLIPVTDGSNIGSATEGIGTLFMSSTIDYGSNLNFVNSATTHTTFGTNGSAIFNAAQNSAADFNVKGDTEANLLFVDVSLNRVGIGGLPTFGVLEVIKSSGGEAMRLQSTASTGFRMKNTVVGDEVHIGSDANNTFFRRAEGVASSYRFSFRRENGAVDANNDKVTIIPSANGGINLFTDTLATAVTTTSNSLRMLFQSSYWNGVTRIFNFSKIQKVAVDTSGVNYLNIDDSIYTHKTFTVLDGISMGSTVHDASALLQLNSTTKGFLTPSMTTVQQDAIGTPAESLMVYNTDLNTHTYNHPVDGFVAIGRYSGAVNSGGGATNQQVQVANLDGEIIPGPLRVGSGIVIPLNVNGVQTNNAVTIGASNFRFANIYGSNITANLGTTQGYNWAGATGFKMTAIIGTGGGIKMEASSRIKANFNSTVNMGVRVTDLSLTAGVGSETDVHVALEVSGNGLMKLQGSSGATIEALTSFASIGDGTMSYISTGDGATLDAVGLWAKIAGTWTQLAAAGAYDTGATYTPTNVSTDRSYDANSTTLDELADVVGTLIADLQGVNILS